MPVFLPPAGSGERWIELAIFNGWQFSALYRASNQLVIASVKAGELSD
jgi:hypothetical protein